MIAILIVVLAVVVSLILLILPFRKAVKEVADPRFHHYQYLANKKFSPEIEAKIVMVHEKATGEGIYKEVKQKPPSNPIITITNSEPQYKGVANEKG